MGNNLIQIFAIYDNNLTPNIAIFGNKLIPVIAPFFVHCTYNKYKQNINMTVCLTLAS